MILAKKKKKKITDPGWVYSSPLTPIPVDNPEFSSTEIYEYIRSPISDWQPDPLNRYTPLMQQMNQAFFEYATEAGPIFIAKATARSELQGGILEYILPSGRDLQLKQELI